MTSGLVDRSACESLFLLEHVFQDEIGQLDHERAEPGIFLKQRHQLGVHICIKTIVFAFYRR